MSNTVTINIVGDFCVQSLNGLKFGDRLDEVLQSADINVVNFESPLKAEGAQPIKKSGPNLCQDDGCTEFLEQHHFNVACLANNHIMDYGVLSLRKTLQAFNKMTLVGAGKREDAYRVNVQNVNGRKIGFLSLTQNEFGVLADAIGQKSELGAAWMLHPCVDEIIVKAKNQCDCLIILPHAGLEHFELPLPELRTLYRHWLSMGADAVIGGHPHVVQGYEEYQGKPIAYSLGNFCFDKSNGGSRWYDGLMEQLQVSDEGIAFTPQLIHYDYENRTVDLETETDKGEHLEDLCRILQNEEVYIKRVNERCLSLEPHYTMLLEMAGYYQPTIRKCLGLIKRFLLHQEPPYNKAHAVNCLRCETHRWVLDRIYKLHQK